MAGFIPAIRQALPALKANTTQEVIKIVLIEELVELVSQSPTITPAPVLPPAVPVICPARLKAPVEAAEPFGLGLLILLVLVTVLVSLCCCCCRCVWSNWPSKGPKRPVRAEPEVEELGNIDDATVVAEHGIVDDSSPVSNESSHSSFASRKSAGNNFAIDLSESSSSDPDSPIASESVGQVEEEGVAAATVSDVETQEVNVELQKYDDGMSEEQESDAWDKLMQQIHGDVDRPVPDLPVVRRDRERRRPVRVVLEDLPPVEPVSDNTEAVGLIEYEPAPVEDSHVKSETVEVAESETEHVEPQSMPTHPVELPATPVLPVEIRPASPTTVRAASPEIAPVEAASPEPLPVDESVLQIDPVKEATEEPANVEPLDAESPAVSELDDDYDMTAAELRALEQSKYAKKQRARLEKRKEPRHVRFSDDIKYFGSDDEEYFGKSVTKPIGDVRNETEFFNNLPENHDGWNSFDGQQQTDAPPAIYEESMHDAELMPEVEDIEIDPILDQSVSEQQFAREVLQNAEPMADVEVETIETIYENLMDVQHDNLESQEQPHLPEQYVAPVESIDEPMNDAAGPAYHEPSSEQYGPILPSETNFTPIFEPTEAEMTEINDILNAVDPALTATEATAPIVQQENATVDQPTGVPQQEEPWMAGLNDTWFAEITAETAAETLAHDLPYRRVISTPASEYECGLYALAESLRAQYQHLIPEEITTEGLAISLRDILLSSIYPLENQSPLQTQDYNNLGPETLARILMRWASMYSVQPLVLGYVVRDAEVGILAPGSCPIYSSNARVLWIHNDAGDRVSDHSVGHWTGLGPAAPPPLAPPVTATSSISNNPYAGAQTGFTHVVSCGPSAIAGQTGTDQASGPSAPVQPGNTSSLPPVPAQETNVQAPWEAAYPALAAGSQTVNQNQVDQASAPEALVPSPFDYQSQAPAPEDQEALWSTGFHPADIDPLLLGSFPTAPVPQPSASQPLAPVSFDFGNSQQPPVFTGSAQLVQPASSKSSKRKAETSVGELSKETAEEVQDETITEPSRVPSTGDAGQSKVTKNPGNGLTAEEQALMKTFGSDQLHRINGAGLATKKTLIALYSSQKYKEQQAANQNSPLTRFSKNERRHQETGQIRPVSAPTAKEQEKQAKDLWAQIAADHERKKRENEMNDAIQRSDEEQDAVGEIDEDYYQHQSSSSDLEAN